MYDPNTCLFIGRWQPFHTGHQALIKTALDDGMDVAVGIRDTGVPSASDPYTLVERWDMIMAWWDGVRGKYRGRHLVCFKVPDISEIRYGRDVGYRVTQVKLRDSLESIRGSELRKSLPTNVPVEGKQAWYCANCDVMHHWAHVCQHDEGY